ncbi:hypothetical protein ACF0H5_023288 [Mactra antiquata]
MFRFIVLCVVAVVAFGNRCHVSNDETALHCADINNMTCASSQYTPFCHKVSDSGYLNGICSCEQFCFTTSDCGSGCWRSHPECREAYANSIEKICVCVRN